MLENQEDGKKESKIAKDGFQKSAFDRDTNFQEEGSHKKGPYKEKPRSKGGRISEVVTCGSFQIASAGQAEKIFR